MAMIEEDFEKEVKVVVLGNGCVGKSSMIRRYCMGTYTDEYKKGEERTVAPAPPTLFPDKFLFMNHPKKKISEATADSKPRRLLKARWPSPVSAKMSEKSRPALVQERSTNRLLTRVCT